MLKCPVIATHISNLTDARYFAARGVDYLLFDLNIISIDEILEIQNWVSGPKVLLLFEEGNAHLLDEAVIKIQPIAIASKNENRSIDHIEGHVDFFSWQNNRIEVNEIEFLPFHAIQNLESQGIIIQGGAEETVGIKPYDQIDEIFDQIELD